MDEALRPCEDRPEDEGEAVFHDEAPVGRTGTGEGPLADDGPDALLADEAPGAAPDDEELAPDAAAEADLLDRARPGADDEPDPEPRPPSPPARPASTAVDPALLSGARALLHTTPRHAVGEERASAAVPAAALAPTFVRPPAPAPGAQVAGQATCPGCGARSGWDARVCGRCGADIPPPIPAGAPAPGAGAPVPLGLPRQVAGATEGEPAGDAADLLPPDVRAQVLAARARNAQHTADITADAARREQVLHVGIAAAAVVGGLVLSGMLDLSTALTAVTLVADLLLGLALARWMWRTDVTSIHGMVAFPAATIVSFACKAVFAPLLVVMAAGPAMFFILMIAMAIGRTVATVLADRASERGF